MCCVSLVNIISAHQRNLAKPLSMDGSRPALVDTTIQIVRHANGRVSTDESCQRLPLFRRAPSPIFTPFGWCMAPLFRHYFFSRCVVSIKSRCPVVLGFLFLPCLQEKCRLNALPIAVVCLASCRVVPAANAAPAVVAVVVPCPCPTVVCSIPVCLALLV